MRSSRSSTSRRSNEVGCADRDRRVSGEVAIVAAARTPFARLGGSLAAVPTVDLGGAAIREAVRRSGVDPSDVDAAYLGLCLPSGGMTAARMAALRGGLPLTTRSLTIDRACCSAMTAMGQAMANIRGGDARVVVAGGMESMSRTPFLMPQARWGQRVGDITIEDPLVIRNPYLDEPMARYTGVTSLAYGVDREAQDGWALVSQQRWQAGEAAGAFDDERFSIEIETQRDGPAVFGRDEHPRPDSTLERLARLPTVYGSPTVTAGNAPGLNDGATATVMMATKDAADRGLRPLATVVAYAAICCEPRESVRLPADAIRAALDAAGLTLAEMALIEINEAFAATVLVSSLVLADRDATEARRYPRARQRQRRGDRRRPSDRRIWGPIGDDVGLRAAAPRRRAGRRGHLWRGRAGGRPDHQGLSSAGAGGRDAVGDAACRGCDAVGVSLHGLGRPARARSGRAEGRNDRSVIVDRCCQSAYTGLPGVDREGIALVPDLLKACS